jgi:hypothetical protein
MTKHRRAPEQLPSHIPSGARELLKPCRSLDEVLQVCEQQKYTCELWGFSETRYVVVLFADQVTGEFRDRSTAYRDYLFLYPVDVPVKADS